MKQTFFIFLLFSGTWAKGQEYVPLINGSAVWYCAYEIPDHFGPYGVKLQEDTLINGMLYKKVAQSFKPDFSKLKIVGYIREDSSKKVYFMNLLFEEGLIYNFGAKKGDTIEISNKHLTDWWDYQHIMENENQVIVDSIFDFEIGNEIPRKAFKLRMLGGQNTEIWIEGIGSLAGILKSGYHAFCCPWGNYLTCFEENSTIVFRNSAYPRFPDCWYIDSTIGISKTKITNESFLLVYPNPVSDYLFIKTDLPTVMKINICNIHGKLVLQQNANHMVRIDTSTLKPGVYIIHVYNQHGVSNTHRIVKL